MKTRTKLFGLAVCLLSAATVRASVITGASASDGAIVVALAVSDNMLSSSLGGASVTAVLGNSSSVTCTFVGSTCASTTGITVGSGNTSDSTTVWLISNTSGQSLTSITIQLAGAAFNPCVTNGVPSTDLTPCTAVTSGAGNARSVSGDTPPGVGSTTTTASVSYTNKVRISGQPSPASDLFTQIQLLFGTNQQLFSSGTSFSFLTDTDLLSGVSIPEPSTYGLVGSALLGLLYRRRSRK